MGADSGNNMESAILIPIGCKFFAVHFDKAAFTRLDIGKSCRMAATG